MSQYCSVENCSRCQSTQLTSDTWQLIQLGQLQLQLCKLMLQCNRAPPLSRRATRPRACICWWAYAYCPSCCVCTHGGVKTQSVAWSLIFWLCYALSCRMGFKDMLPMLEKYLQETRFCSTQELELPYRSPATLVT